MFIYIKQVIVLTCATLQTSFLSIKAKEGKQTKQIEIIERSRRS
jgi:hypothetical protein